MFSPQRVRSALLSALVVFPLLLTGASTAGASSASGKTSCDQIIRFDREDFTHPTVINNKWLPLVPGMQFTLEGRANQDGAPLPHRVVLTVTDLTKVIDGVRTVVLWDRDFNDDQLAEAELAFEAQDSAGNVWNLGEYPEEYESGVFVGAPSTWIAGLDGAKAGIHMLAKPRLGTPSYVQGLARKIDFLDCGQVADKGQSVTVPVDSYDHVLVINEWSPLDPDGGIQVKYYAPGVGNVQIGAVDDPEGETLVLVGLAHLSPSELAQARAEALALDSRAYEVSHVYRKTPPAE
jgi:hypothetical protein